MAILGLGVMTKGISDVVEWQIPDFVSIRRLLFLDSSHFSLRGCTWCLRVYPGESVEVYLIKVKDDATVNKTVTFYLGIKKKDDILESRRYTNCTFTGVHCPSKIPLYFKGNSEFLPSGTLTIMCFMEREVSCSEEADPNPRQVDPRLVELETLSSDLKDLLTGERRCDFIIKVQGKEFRTHRLLLSARSPVFRAMLEHDTAEAKSGILTIPDCDPESFGEFLTFLYTGKTEEMGHRTAYHLYATAEKYDVQQLKSFCASYLKQNLTPENVCDVVLLADDYGDEEFLSFAQDFFNKNSFRIFLTSEWKAMLKNNVRLVDKLLSEMSSAALKIS